MLGFGQFIEVCSQTPIDGLQFLGLLHEGLHGLFFVDLVLSVEEVVVISALDGA
jgi:hypothetical protein